MKKTFLQNLGFAAIAIGFMAISIDSVLAQAPDNLSINLNNCVKSFQLCRTQGGVVALPGCKESWNACVQSVMPK